MRKATETWLGRSVLTVALGLIIISFAIWGIGNIFHGFGSNEAATVGQTKVSANAYRRAYEAQMLRFRAANGQQANAAGLDNAVLGALVADAALAERARTLGLAVGQAQVEKLVVEDPTFQNQFGAFDPTLMNRALAEQGYTTRDLSSIYTRRQIAAAITSGINTPKLVEEIFSRFSGEKRTVQYLVLPPSTAGTLRAPADADLRKFYEAHKNDFRLREYRSIVVLSLTPEALARPDQVSDDEARKLYDQVADGRFGAAERRAVQQLSFPSEAQAKAAEEKIQAGANFQDIAKDKGVTFGDAGGEKTKAESGDVANVAFGLTQGAVSDPVKVANGFALLRVTKIVPATLRPFAEVAPQLKQQIAERRITPADLDKVHDSIEGLRTSGKPLLEAAKGVLLAPREITAIDASGRDKMGHSVTGLVEESSLLKAVFASDVGLDNETLQLSSGGYQWFEVRKVEPARNRTFEEAKADVEARWRSAEIAGLMATKATEMVRRVNAGTALGSLIPNAQVKTADGITRSENGKVPGPLMSEAFKTPLGSAGLVRGEGEDRIIFKVTAVTAPPFDPGAKPTQRFAANFANAMSLEVLRAYAMGLEDEFGLQVNQGVLSRSQTGGQPQPLDED